MTRLEFHLLNDLQRAFPLVPEPYATVAAAFDIDADTVMSTLARLQQGGAIGRIGAVFRPGAIGASTLAAMAVPPERLATVAKFVSEQAEVNHNYAREHRFNLWFVVAASTRARVDRVLERIASTTGLAVLDLPLVEEYHIDLGFDLADGGKVDHEAAPAITVALDAAAEKLVAALQRGLALVPRPYRRLADAAGMSETEAIDQLEHWQRAGVIRRFGVIVRHLELGYGANAMTVWDVPDRLVGDLGGVLAREPGVNLCYRRRRALPDWRYNLYCMIHGRERAEVERRIAAVSASAGLTRYARSILFSRTRFKQTGASYVAEATHGSR